MGRGLLGVLFALTLASFCDGAVYWRDQRSGLTTAQKGATAVNGTIYYVTPGRALTLALEAVSTTADATVEVSLTQGGLPKGATLTNPSTPANSMSATFSWTPTADQQCEYQLCFIATDSTGVVSTGPSSSPTAAGTDERCYSIVVTEQSIFAEGGTFVDATPFLSSLTSSCGWSIGFWVKPSTQIDMDVLTAGYMKGGTVRIGRNKPHPGKGEGRNRGGGKVSRIHHDGVLKPREVKGSRAAGAALSDHHQPRGPTPRSPGPPSRIGCVSSFFFPPNKI